MLKSGIKTEASIFLKSIVYFIFLIFNAFIAKEDSNMNIKSIFVIFKLEVEYLDNLLLT